MNTVTTIHVDLARPGPLPRAYAVQGEKNSRQIIFCLHENGVPWGIDAECGVAVHYRRADGTGGSFNANADGAPEVTISENLLHLTLSAAMCARPGPVTLVVELSKDDTAIATWPILVQVAANPGCQDPSGYIEGIQWTPNRYLGTDENGNVVAKGYLDGSLELDLTAYAVDYSKAVQVLDVTDAIEPALLQALAEGKEPRLVRVKFLSGAGQAVEMALHDRFVMSTGFYAYFGTSGNLTYVSYSTMFLVFGYDADAGTWHAKLRCYMNQLKDFVKTVNGQAPDEGGNVEVAVSGLTGTAKLDFTNWDSGSFTETLSDGTTVEHTVTRDADGNITAIDSIEIVGVS